MYCRGGEAADSILVSFESELDKECALEKEGAPERISINFLIGSEYGTSTGGGQAPDRISISFH